MNAKQMMNEAQQKTLISFWNMQSAKDSYQTQVNEIEYRVMQFQVAIDRAKAQSEAGLALSQTASSIMQELMVGMGNMNLSYLGMYATNYEVAKAKFDLMLANLNDVDRAEVEAFVAKIN